MTSAIIKQHGGYGVDVQLQHGRTTDDVYWSDRGNSYVIAVSDNSYNGCWRTEDGKTVALYSINGIGEIRWTVTTVGDREEDEAIKHFNLIFIPWEQRDAY